jgi:lactate permease
VDVIVAVAPIIILIVLMTKRNSVPSHRALPAVAVLLYGIKLIYFASDPNLINATVVNGLLTALTPIVITWGAICLFKTMEYSGSMGVIRGWLNGISDNPVAQLMIVGWAFAFMIEGASGFGTPAALAAPILVGLGFAPLRVAILCLIMNSVPVSFGAVGTPTWFGMGQLGLDSSQFLAISRYSAMIHAVAALVVPLVALSFVVERQLIARNLFFVFSSILACVLPYALLARINYEFPALVGGAVGLIISMSLAKKGIGLAKEEQGTSTQSAAGPRILIKSTFPLWGTVLVLLITRIGQLGVKAMLTDPTPLFQIGLGSLAQFSVSRSLVLTVKDIYGASSIWEFQTLYIPALIPFLLISIVAFGVFRLDKAVILQLFSETYQRMIHPIMALLGALVMVKLLMIDGHQAMVMIIGDFFAGVVGQKWEYFATYLGALGSFFSGSATISNLTFAGIQQSIATNLGLDVSTILAMQSVGAAMGNMVCINNIVAVCSILGIANQEGFILKKTFVPMILYGVIAAVVCYFL